MTRWDPKAARIQAGQDLTAIEDTYVRLRAEAYHHAGDSDIPGGMAMVLLGPRADLEAWNYVQLSAMVGRTRLGHKDATVHEIKIELEAFDQYEIEPPLSFLAGWVDIIREERGQEPGPRWATIASEVGYLRDALDWILATDHDNGTPWWLPAIDFIDQLNVVRNTLERLLREDEQRDTGAPCLNEQCDGVRLVKHWAGTKDHPLSERFDYWTCSRCRRRYSADEYANACKQAGRLHADRLTETDMHEVYRVNPSTLRTWVQRGTVRKRGRNDSGRTLYDVSDTLKARDLVQGESA